MRINNENQNGNNRSRREILRNLASAGTVATVGTGVVSADRSQSTKDVLLTFDPQNPEEVREAYLQLISLPTREEVENVVRKLSEAQLTALRDVSKDTEVVTTVETSDGTRRQLSSDVDSVSVSLEEDSASINSTGDKTIKAVSKLKNAVGTTEATFKHFVYWEYDGTSVMNESHWQEVSTGVAYNYDGLSTDYLDNRGDEAVSKKIADFSSCLGGPCVTKNLGSHIWMFENGGWTVNKQ